MMSMLDNTPSRAAGAPLHAAAFALDCAGAALALPQGFGHAGLAAAAAGAAPDPAMLRPPALHRRVLQLDPSSALAAAAAVALRDGALAGVAAERVGIVLATRYGSNAMARQFADRVRRGSAGPALFAAAGYNAGAGLAAMAAGVNGPSVALSGARASLAAAVERCRQLLQRGDADAMLAIVCDSEHGGGRALAAALALRRAAPGAAPWRPTEAAAPAALRAACAPFPWLHDDAATVLALAGGGAP